MALCAVSDIDGRAARQFAGRIGVGGPNPDTRGSDVDAILAGIDLILDEHPLAHRQRHAVDRLEAG